MSGESDRREGSYVFDAESATETARLMLQDRLLTKAMGGVFPASFDLSNVHHILDIGCGPGGWVLDAAFATPHIDIAGIDISQRMIRYANAQAKVLQRLNASFEVMDALQPLGFSDATFDIVNARTIQGAIPRDTWPSLLKESFRILRPGGRIRLTETEWGITNSAGYEKMMDLFCLAFYRSGKGFSPTGRQVSITPVQARLLQDSGFQDIYQEAYAVNFSAGMEAFEGFYQNHMVGFQTIQPFLVKMGVTTEEEVDQVYQQMMFEMNLDTFCGVWYLMSTWGTKPV
jgi:ubiquinone/menaquinone biosynthesis C-methylase UbiE